MEADGHSASLCTEASSMSVTPSSTTTQPATTSFRDLLPVPHHARPSFTRAVRKKPPTHELTSDESLKFVIEVLDKQKSKIKPQKKQKQKGQKPRHAIEAPNEEVDHEPCAMCKVAYGDPNDPNKKDDWECCKHCKRWWHETCAALCGTFSNRNVFSCDQCVYSKKKKLA
jgi:hypothetical protein